MRRPLSRWLLAVALGLPAFTGLSGQVGAATIYATSWALPNSNQPPASLYSVDSATASSTLVGQLLGTPGVFPSDIVAPFGLAFDPAGDLYTFDGFDFYRVNPATGAISLVGPLGVVGGGGDLTFDPANGSFYAVAGNPSVLYTINPATGRATEIAPLSGFGNATQDDPVEGLAFGSGGALYGLAMGGSLLVTIDPATGRGTPVGSTGALSTYGNGGLAFDPSSGTLYMTEGKYLYTVDTSTGTAKLIGDMKIGPYVNGLAIRGSAVPEASGWAMILSAGLSLVGTWAWRRSSYPVAASHGHGSSSTRPSRWRIIRPHDRLVSPDGNVSARISSTL